MTIVIVQNDGIKEFAILSNELNYGLLSIG
jgi:hypothetical protein